MSNSMTRKEIEEQLIVKSWQDSTFKQALLIDPKSALKQEGIILPESTQVRVVEETPDTFYIVIPVQPSDSNGTEVLSEAELEAIAGGYLDGGGCLNVKAK